MSLKFPYFFDLSQFSDANRPQPNPLKQNKPALWDAVIKDVAKTIYVGNYLIDAMRERNEMGIKKYGTPLQAGNGRNPITDAFQEILDCIVYLEQARQEGIDVDDEYLTAMSLVRALAVRMIVHDQTKTND